MRLWPRSADTCTRCSRSRRTPGCSPSTRRALHASAARSGVGGRGTALSPAQIARFLKECSPRWRLFFTVALDTGLLRGKMIGLQRRDVALLERVIYVRRSIGAYDDRREATMTRMR